MQFSFLYMQIPC